MAKQPKMARMNVRYGKFRAGETIRGALAEQLISDGMATDVTPRVKAKKAKTPAPANKAKAAAPENKEGFDPNAG